MVWNYVPTFVTTMKKEEIIRIRISDTLKKKFKAFAKKQGVSMSEYILDVIKKATQ